MAVTLQNFNFFCTKIDRERPKKWSIFFLLVVQSTTEDVEKNKWKPLPYTENNRKVPLVVFGNGMFGKDLVKLRGNRCGVTGKLWMALKKQERECGHITVVIDEFNTSKTCNNCQMTTLKPAKHTRGHSVLVSKTCNTCGSET